MSRLITLAMTPEEAAFFFAFTTAGIRDVSESYEEVKKQGALELIPNYSNDFEEKRDRVIELMADAMANSIDLDN